MEHLLSQDEFSRRPRDARLPMRNGFWLATPDHQLAYLAPWERLQKAWRSENGFVLKVRPPPQHADLKIVQKSTHPSIQEDGCRLFETTGFSFARH